MDYEKAYGRLIARARSRGRISSYVEVHHVLPRSLGGSDDECNLVALTYREHFLAHWLLTKMTEGLAKRKMVFAFWAMGMSAGGRIISSWRFETIKRNAREQWLITRKQRLRFQQEQKIDALADMLSSARRNYRNSPTPDTFLGLHRAEDNIKARMSQGEDPFVRKKLARIFPDIDASRKAEVKRLLPPKKQRSHEERLARWKASRLGPPA